jgi:L-ascorbate metabolism protein UlaG (beta-lactamase superfamily)
VTAVRITYVGHSTLLVELDGLRVLTDPVLRSRVAHLTRRAPAVETGVIADIRVVLVSHMHPDHFDPPSLRLIDRQAELVVPRGAGRTAGRLGFQRVTELGEGETLAVGGIEIAATHAEHRQGRLFDKRSEAIGYKLTGSQRVYFAGDTDLFPGMSSLAANLDVALLPVGGWGPKLGPGHLDPRKAAEALELLRPRVAVPIHWGTLYRIGLRRSKREPAGEPPLAFAREAAQLAPSVEVRVLEPGETTTVEAV